MHEPHPLFVRRLSRGQLMVLDLLAGLAFSLLFLTAVTNATGVPPWARLVIPFALGLPLALRRSWPMPIFCLTLALAILAVLLGAVTFAYVSPAYALYVVALADIGGARVPTTAIAGLTLVTLGGLVMAGGVRQTGEPTWTTHLDVPLIGIAALGGAWTVGRAVRERRVYAARDADRLAEQAVTEERLRIARELHDVVAHSVGLIAVKAGVANHVMSTKPEEAQDALRVIETASRSALVEMRHLLGVLRSAEVPDLGPAPGLSGLAGLAEQAKMAGVDVDLDVRLGSEGNRLPEGVELSVYRIVQEALTNVVKHAAPARCRVTLVADEREVRIEVMDDGPGRRVIPVEAAGHGLIGMRERIMMYGGEFEARGIPGQGFRVVARLPYVHTSPGGAS
ncbi:sensor histidine kinase [Nonomuraea sp. NPDC048916]|uniref:sensor histidine kinase n=1 Tax=Nonomuraea sp. NPDC048916 TaxID=3154232 RepID=UPI0033FEF829